MLLTTIYSESYARHANNKTEEYEHFWRLAFPFCRMVWIMHRPVARSTHYFLQYYDY